MHNRITTLLAVLLACAGPPLAAHAQETVTKTTTQQIPLKPGDQLQMSLEKATVRVVGWDKRYADMHITLTATHSDRRTAARELAYMQYAVARDGNVVTLQNAYILPAGIDAIHSKLGVTIELHIPATQALTVKAKYSNITLQHTAGNANANLEFSDLDLTDVGGTLTLTAAFSEIRSEAQYATTFKSDDNNCQYALQIKEGNATFKSRHSQIDLTVQSLRGLTIDAEHTDVTLRGTPAAGYIYDIVNRSGKIYAPATYERYRQQDTKRATLQTPAEAGKPSIHIHTTYNAITIH
jgi:hypothetical protein